MAIFGNKKKDELQRCRDRCQSWLFNIPDLIPTCEASCNDNRNLTRDQFLCSGQYIEELSFMRMYGYDPCPGSGYTLDEGMKIVGMTLPVAPAAASEPKSNVQEKKGIPGIVWIGGGILLLVGLYFLFFAKKT